MRSFGFVQIICTPNDKCFDLLAKPNRNVTGEIRGIWGTPDLSLLRKEKTQFFNNTFLVMVYIFDTKVDYPHK